MTLRLAFTLALVVAAVSRAQAWQVEAVDTPGPILELIEVGSEPHIATAAGWARAVPDGRRIVFEPVRAPRFAPLPANAMPDSRVAIGKGEIARAWLAGPTARYRHGVLGDAIEADRIEIEHRSGKRDSVEAGGDAVFEDLQPRIVNLGGDGDWVVAVKSYLTAGSALAVIGERDGRYAVVAETPPIGTPNRWLSPAGVADFSGTGSVEIAIVRMPHALGRLELWRWHAGRLLKVMETRDTSNHAIGSRALGLSAVADFDGDGVADLAIPSFDRHSIRLLSFRGGVREIARLLLPAAATTDFVRLARSAAPDYLIGLADGTLVRLRP